jgi:hypothetical protein
VKPKAIEKRPRSASWPAGGVAGGGVIFPVMEAGKGMPYRLAWQWELATTNSCMLYTKDTEIVLTRKISEGIR